MSFLTHQFHFHPFLFPITYLLRNPGHLPSKIFHILNSVLLWSHSVVLFFLKLGSWTPDSIRLRFNSFGKTMWCDILLPRVCLSVCLCGLSSCWSSAPRSIHSLVVQNSDFSIPSFFFHFLDKMFLQRDAFLLLTFGYPVIQFVQRSKDKCLILPSK